MTISTDREAMLEQDIRDLREANSDWADTAAMLRDDLRIAKAGLREFAKDALRLEDELSEAKGTLDFVLTTADLLLEQVRAEQLERGRLEDALSAEVAISTGLAGELRAAYNALARYQNNDFGSEAP